jgi:hypothetical protein
MGAVSSYPTDTADASDFLLGCTSGGVVKRFDVGEFALLGAGENLLTNGTSNWFNFGTVGFTAPTFTTRSDGTKLLLYPALSGSTTDYAIGIAASQLWFSVPGSGVSFKWYAGTTAIADLNGVGHLSLAAVFLTDDPYGAGWDGSNAVPTKNAVWDKIETLQKKPAVYRLTANHSNSTTTPSTITDGTTAWTHTLVAGKTYHFRIFGTYQAAAVTTGGRMNLLGAGGLAGTVAGMMWGAIVQAAAASTLEAPIYTFANGAGAFLQTTAVNPINSPHIWGAEFVFHCTTGGTLSLQWASEVAASASQLNSGSVMFVEELN